MDGKHHNGGVCMACGGVVDDDGQTMPGEVESAEHELPMEVDGDTSPQLQEAERLRTFANAVKGRR